MPDPPARTMPFIWCSPIVNSYGFLASWVLLSSFLLESSLRLVSLSKQSKGFPQIFPQYNIKVYLSRLRFRGVSFQESYSVGDWFLYLELYGFP